MNLNKHGDDKKKFEKTWPYFEGMKEKRKRSSRPFKSVFSPHTSPESLLANQ